jgi:hypothetical protein
MNARIAVLPLVAVLAACATAGVAPAPRPAPPPSPVATYFPLAVGNQWTYETRYGPRVETNTVSIVAEEGGVYTDNRNNRFFVDEDGLRDERRYLLHAPLVRGTTWKSTVDVGRTETYEIVDTGATVTVPAGTFPGAVVVRGRSRVDPTTELQVEWTYAPGVGLVRIATFALAGRDRIPQAVSELTEYRVR